MPLDADERLGVALNLDRVRARRMNDLATAIAVGLGRVDPPEWWLEHLTDSPEEAKRWRLEAMLNAVASEALSGGR